MKYFLPIILFFIACKSPHTNDIRKTFEINAGKLPIDTPFCDAELYGNNLILILEDGHINILDDDYNHITAIEKDLSAIDAKRIAYKFGSDIFIELNDSSYIILDSLANRKPEQEKLLNQFHRRLFFYERYNRTIIQPGGGKYYLLNQNYELILMSEFDLNKLAGTGWIGEILWEDSIYTISACCSGEFGGNVFFLNQKTLKKYYCSMTCARYATKIRDHYVIIADLKHMAGTTVYVNITNPAILTEPSKLYDTINGETILCCECDGTPYYPRGSKQRDSFNRAIGIYYDTIGVLTPMTFNYQDTLYSIQLTDSLYRIVKHDDNKIVLLDTIKRYPNDKKIHSESKNTIGRKLMEIVDYTYWSSDGDSKIMTRYFEKAILLVKNNHIDILSYDHIDKKEN